MDISALTNLATQMSQQRTSQAVGVTVLKKALDIQQANATTLIEAVTPAQNLPDHLGQKINVIA